MFPITSTLLFLQFLFRSLHKLNKHYPLFSSYYSAITWIPGYFWEFTLLHMFSCHCWSISTSVTICRRCVLNIKLNIMTQLTLIKFLINEMKKSKKHQLSGSIFSFCQVWNPLRQWALWNLFRSYPMMLGFSMNSQLVKLHFIEMYISYFLIFPFP